MKQFFIQCLKDFKANFNNLNAYIILGGYSLLSFSFAIYLGDYFVRESNIVNSYFSMQPMILMLILPAVTMRAWADEIKSGTIELLLTQPISYTKLILAKFTASYLFFCIMVLFSVPFFFITNKLSIVDYGAAFTGYLGLFLCGAMFTSIGCFISSLNRNNILSYISAIFVIFFVSQFELSTFTIGSVTIPLQQLNFADNYNAFMSGMVSSSNFCYFVFYTSLFLWLNTVTVSHKKAGVLLERKRYFLFCILLSILFVSSLTGIHFIFGSFFDLTDENKFTLSNNTKEILNTLNKRIDVTLYESKDKREEVNSSYAVYAEYVEKVLKLIEQDSKGAVRVKFNRVAPFSLQEKSLMHNKIPFEEDKFGHKIFMSADFSDNDGNNLSINAFNNLRQDLLETDIMRTINRFGVEKKNIALFINSNESSQLSALSGILKEFYNVTYFDFPPQFIPSIYSSVIVINPKELSSEFLLAMEQYVLRGGTLLIFSDPNVTGKQNENILKKFLANFGINLNVGKIVEVDSSSSLGTFGAAIPEKDAHWNGIRSVLVNKVGEISIQSQKYYTVSPILTFGTNLIGAVSQGSYVSDYIQLAQDSEEIEAVSTQPGQVFFFYDTDLLKNYLYVSEESKSHQFYEIIPVTDNMLFILRLMDFATGENIEKNLSYRHFKLNPASIGNTIFNNAKEHYAKDIHNVQQQIDKFEQQKKDIIHTVSNQGFASVKKIENINNIAQDIDEAQYNMSKFKALIMQDYQNIIMILTLLLIFVFPTVFLVLMALIIFIFRRLKSQKIRRLIANA